MAFTTSTEYDQGSAEKTAAAIETNSFDEEVDCDPDTELLAEEYDRPVHRRTRSQTFSRVLAFGNLILFLVLLGTWISVLKTSFSGSNIPEPPYSKIREDGAVKFVTKTFSGDHIFEQEPSDEVDEAWKQTVQHDNVVGLSKEFAETHGLPRSVESSSNPDLQIYGISVFHQLHCLDLIRKAFYPERYYPHEDTKSEDFLFHKNHCFEFLRAILVCKADVNMIYWWNSNYTTTEADGTTRDSDYYLSLTPRQREEQSYIKWDVPRQCHDFGSVVSWLNKNRLGRTQ